MTDPALSRRLSYLLRHAPHEAGLTLAPGGWVPLAPLLRHLNATRAQVEAVVTHCDKGRFSLRGDHIRANQGHSVPVDLQLQPASPPAHPRGCITARTRAPSPPSARGDCAP